MANINRPVIPEGNDTALCIQIKYYKAGEYLDFDLTQVSDLKVNLTCSKHNTIIPLEFTIDEADHSILHCPIDYRLLHANTSYGVSVSGYDAESIHFKWTMLPREGFLVVPNTSGTNVTDEVQIIDLQGRVGWGGIDMSEYIPKSEKGQANGVATLDRYGNVPESQLNLRLAAYIKKSEKGQANGVATLGSDGKVPAYQLQDYILSSQKGQPNGVATLNSVGLIPEGQLQFPTRGQLNPANINNLEAGVYQVNGKVIAPEILDGMKASGILVAYPYGSKVQMLYVGREAGAASGEQVEVYSRRYLSTPQRWTQWNRIDDKDQYSLTKSGSNIQLTKNGTVIASVVDSNTTYANMSQTEANAGTATTARSISAKVLSTTIQNKIDNNKVEINGTVIDNYEIEFPEGSYELVIDAISKGKYIIMTIDNYTDYILSGHGDNWVSFSAASAEEGYIAQANINDDNTGELFYHQINDYENNYNVRLNGSTLIIPNNTYSNIMSDIDRGLTLSQINLYLDNIYLFKMSRRPNKNDYLTFEHDNAEEGWMAQIEITPNNQGMYSFRTIPNYEVATPAQIVTGTDDNAKVVSPKALNNAWSSLFLEEMQNEYDRVVIPARLVGNQVYFDEEEIDIFNRIHQFIFNYPELEDRCKIILNGYEIYNLALKAEESFYFECTNAEEHYIASICLYRGDETVVFSEYFRTDIPNEPYYKKITAADLTWNNGWMQGGTGDMSRVEFVKYGKVVYVNGTILNKTAGATLSSILTIPTNLPAFRPKRTVQWMNMSQQNFVVDGANRVPSYFIQLDKNGVLKIEKMNIGGVGTQYQANKNIFISGSYIVD